MTILNNENDGLYPELIVLFRATVYEKSIASDDLINFCSPVGEKPEGAKRLKGALLRWEKLGLFDREQGNIRITPELLPQGNKLSVDLLTNSLPILSRRLLMKEDNCLPLWGDASENEKGNGTAADFIRAISWTLSQNIYTFPKVWEPVEQIEISQMLYGNKIFSSSFRFNAFRHWSRYLGFASGDSGSFQIDPSVAIRDELPLVFGNQQELSAKDFLSALRTQLPVLDNGVYRREVESNMNPAIWRNPNEGHLSMSLSFALRRLDLSGAIKLKGQADAGSSVRLTGHTYQTWIGFESVVWNGGRV